MNIEDFEGIGNLATEQINKYDRLVKENANLKRQVEKMTNFVLKITKVQRGGSEGYFIIGEQIIDEAKNLVKE